MSQSAIRVENISKRYRIGIQKKADTFIGQVTNAISYPIRNLRNIARLSSFKDGDDPSIFWALRDINFEVRRGEVLGIIGHNGAGKSTLLKILSRITEPTTGAIEIRGRVSSLLEVGTGFHPELTGRDNVYMNGTILGMTKREIDQKFDEIVAFAGVEKHIYTPVKFYSSGMKVRLGFSVAAHLEPDILVIDEVLAVGDFEFQKRCLGKMNEVSQSGRTVLFVSHDMGAVENLCPRTILLNSGGMEFDGPTAETLHRYLTKFDDKHEEDLSMRKDRIGNGLIRVQRCKVFSMRDGREGVNAITGNDLLIDFEYTSASGEEISNVLVGCSIRFQGKILFSCNTKYDIGTFKEIPPNGVIRCRIPRLPLVDGEYLVDYYVKVGNDIVDKLEAALKMKVLRGQYFRTNRLPGKPNKTGRILVQNFWEIVA